MAEDWRLRDEHGELRTLTTQQLRDSLAAGTIPSSVLVARGTKEFQPAFSVPELATAAIRAKRTPSMPPTSPAPATGGATPAPPGLRPAPPRVPVVPRTAQPGAADVPPPPRSRRRIAHTLVGIQGDEEGLPPSEVAPIVAPGSGGGARKAITQVPRYTPAPSAPSSVEGDAVVIPRAPRAPQAGSLAAGTWDGREVRSTGDSSIFDGDEDAQTLVQKDDPTSRKPARPPGPPPKAADRRPGSHHPPPLPPRKDGASPPARPPLRNTVMGLGTGGDRGAPRLVPPKQTSTPPPAPVRASTSTPPPGQARASTSTPPPLPASSSTPPPAAARPVSRPPPGPPPLKKTPVPPQVAAPPATTASSSSPAEAPQAPHAEAASPAHLVGAPKVATAQVGTTEGKAAEGTPTVPMPEAREAATTAATEGTPTVPMPEARESSTDVDEAPTSRMQVQIVHGAALAMRAALAAPHFEAPTGSASEPAPAATALPAVQEGPSSKPPAGSEASATSSPPLALPPSPGTTIRGLGPSSAPPPPTTSSAPPAEEEEEPAEAEEPAPHSGVEVPVSSLFAASAVWIVGLVSVFFVGRCSALEARPESARRGVATTARLAVLAVSPGGATSAEPKPCWVTRQPSKWAPQASRNVPFEMVAMPGGGALLVGYGLSDEKGLGLRVDPRSGKFESIHEETVAGGIARVTPLPGKAKDDAPKFFASPRADTALVPVPGADPPFFVRFSKSEIAALDAPDGSGTTLFSLAGEDRPNTEQVLVSGQAGYYASFRRGEGIHGAWIGADRQAVGEVKAIAGSGGKVGKPRAGWNGKEVAVVFADRPEGAAWQVRVGRAAAGSVPGSTEVFDLPAGGPGGDAIAPDVVGLPDGRWLVMWTEGSSGKRAIRSLTLAPDWSPLGDPIALSPPAGNFGQAQLAVVGGYVTVLFLQDGDEGYELWGAVLQCG